MLQIKRSIFNSSNKDIKILFLYNNYFLQDEIIEIFNSLGIETYILDISNLDFKYLIFKLLSLHKKIKYNMVFSTNFIGLDSNGLILKQLIKLKIYFVSWFLDDFRFIINQKNIVNNELITIFTYDKAHVALLKKIGFDNSYYLPTATSLKKPIKYSHNFNYLHNSITFIGNTFYKTQIKYYKMEYDKYLNNILLTKDIFNNSIFDKIKSYKKILKNEFEYYNFASFMAAKYSYSYRKSCLKAISSENLHIFGDEHWKNCNFIFNYHSPVDYKYEAPSIYKNSLINLNISSKQHILSTNMRVFDIPYSGGFMLTDYNPILEELFNIKDEIVYYQSIDELKEKLYWYSNKPQNREDIVIKASKKIEKKHKLSHRIQKLFFILKKQYN